MIGDVRSLVDRADGSQLDKFRWYVNERFSIMVRRTQGGPAPWTDSIELQTHRFCNTFRMLDRGSQTIIRMMNAMPEGTSELDDLVLAVAYRKTNSSDGWREAVERFGLPTAATMVDWLHDVDGSGIMIQNSRAYNVANGAPRGQTLVASLADTIQHCLDDHLLDPVIGASFDEQISTLDSIPRVGQFIAQQILTDYGYGRSGYDRIEDRGVVAGPGSIRGIRWILPDEDIGRSQYSDVIPIIHEWLMSDDHPTMFVLGYVHEMTLMDTQNCLCEFDKLNRIQSGRGFRRPYSAGMVRPLEVTAIPNSWREDRH